MALLGNKEYFKGIGEIKFEGKNSDNPLAFKYFDEIGMNDIAQVTFKLNKPIFYDKFKDHRTNGSFILINPQSNSTVGAGFIS